MGGRTDRYRRRLAAPVLNIDLEYRSGRAAVGVGTLEGDNS